LRRIQQGDEVEGHKASAIIGMTKVWAMELGKFGITVNCIAPGFI
jgi:hypothetical protein